MLLDGHRIAPNNANGSVNTDVLPEMLIQRVDVVTGGASAVYGSDAVSGVINFILDKRFSGMKVQTSVGTNSNGLGTQDQGGIAAGQSLFDGRGHIEGTLRYFHQNQVLANQLPYGKDGQVWALAGNGTAASPYFVIPQARRNDQPFGGLISCTGCAVNGLTFVQNGVLGPYDKGAPSASTTPLLSIGGTGRVDLASAVVTKLVTKQAFGRFSYDFDDHTTAFIQVRAAQAENFNNGPNNGLPPGSGSAARPNVFYTDNPFLTAATRAQLETGNTRVVVAPDGTTHKTFGFVNYQGALSGQSPALDKVANMPIYAYASTDRNYSTTLGIEGKISDKYNWELYYTHDENRGSTENPLNTNFQKLYASQDAVTLPNGTVVCYVSTTQYASLYPGCVPSNPFGPSSLSADSYAYSSRSTKFVMDNKMDDIGGSIAGEIFRLPAGAVKLALSGEARRQSYRITSNAEPAQVDCTGLRLCSTATPLWFQTTIGSVAAKQSVWEVAGELAVPLLRDVPLIKELSMNLAGRYTDYSVSGTVKTWKAGLDYHVNDIVRIRATASRDIRAPTLNDLFAPAGQAVSPLNDLYTGKSADTVQFSRGNPNLRPEVARTDTAGIVFTPPQIPTLTLSTDYYRINLQDAITTVSYTTQAVQQICINAIKSGGQSAYCDLAARPNPLTDSSQANFPTSITSLSLNSAVSKTEGVDVEVSYRPALEKMGLPGSVSLRGLASYQRYLTSIALPGSSPTFTVMPKGRFTAFVGYEINDWNFNGQIRWLSSYDQSTFTGQVYAQPRIPSYTKVDLNISKTLWANTGMPLQVYLSVQNVFNKLYPLAPSTNTTSNPGLIYPVPGGWGDVLGRYFTVGFRHTF